jgi:predicted ATPase
MQRKSSDHEASHSAKVERKSCRQTEGTRNRATMRAEHQGKRDAARDLLASVYGSFTEGFDTLDLTEAKALLEELRA